ncbi:hypothetical protein CDS [Bradyrhizobium sp.]|nr:hypothetical protein CDS [Bradyrhizobium sp.]
MTDLEREYIESRISEKRLTLQSIREARGKLNALPANRGV